MYGVLGEIVVSHDAGLTWSRHTPRPINGGITVGSNPAVVLGNNGPTMLFTSDGVNFRSVNIPSPVLAVDPFTAVADATSPTGQRLLCDGWRSYDPLRPLAAGPLPYAEGLRGSPDAPGAYAILGDKLLGDAQSDWSWTSLLGATGGIGPAESAAPVDAWPAKGGTTFIAQDLKGYWVRRGTGRWWRLQAFGAGLSAEALLDSSHLIVRPAGPFAQPAVLDLSVPAVGAPSVQPSAGGLTCAVAWRPEDAEAAGYAWRRDGAALRGATGAQYKLGAFDAGHQFTCEVTARNGWGSVALASPLPYLVPGERVVPARPRLTGKARVGALLRCSASLRLTWFRDGHAVPGRHARTYLVRARDAGHAIACQTRLADGKRLRSLGVRIARRSVRA